MENKETIFKELNKFRFKYFATEIEALINVEDLDLMIDEIKKILN